MRRTPALLLAALALCTACQTAPLTGRRQFLPLPPSVENEIGANAWAETLAAAQTDGSLVTTGPRAQRVQRVGRAIEAAAKRHPETKELAETYEWEFVLLSSTQVNAWALPGGKCAVYTGLLDVATEESELAAVMGHEVAHALARHSGERMSQTMLVNLGLTAAALLSGDMDEEDRTLLMASLGLATQAGVLLPFSRAHESEADEIGVLLSADAGYDPRGAITLWQKMGALGGERPPELLSTHPSETTRVADLEDLMPKATKIWNRAKAAGR